jgi:hypothetical protein
LQLYVCVEFVFIFVSSHNYYVFFFNAGNVCVYWIICDNVKIFLNCCLTYATKAVLLLYPFYRYFHGSPTTDITSQVPEHCPEECRCYNLVSCTHSFLLITNWQLYLLRCISRVHKCQAPGFQDNWISSRRD